MDATTLHDAPFWWLLLVLGDLLAFAGWIGVWVYTKSWPHVRIMRWILLSVAWYRLCEGLLLIYGLTVRPWLHDIDVLLRFGAPLTAVVYLAWLTRHYRVEFQRQDPRPFFPQRERKIT